MPQTLEERLTYMRQWRENNRDKVRAHGRKNHATHRTEHLAKRQTYRDANPALLKAQHAADHAKHRDERLVKMHDYYEANKDWMLPEMREYQREHAEEKREYLTTYYLENKEEFAAKAKIYVSTHLDEFAERNRARRARKNNAPINDLTHAQWLEIQASQDHRCAHCKKNCKNKLTQDHVTPLSQGGSHTLHNVIGVCRNCNSKKGTKPSPVLVQPLLLTVAPSKKKQP